MKEKIGETYPGIISSVTNFGLFIELENTIEGLVHVSNMTDDYYNFDERHQTLIGERTGKVYRIGEEVKVQVSKVNLDERSEEHTSELQSRGHLVCRLPPEKKKTKDKRRRRLGTASGTHPGAAG